MMVRCPTCGASNAADDQFCGTCGTALAATTVKAPEPGAGPIVDPPGPTMPIPPSDPLAGPAQDCQVCGTANAVSRTFCRVCGSTLAGGGAPAGRRQPEDRASSTPGAPVGTGSSRAAQAAARSGTGSGWLMILAALGLLAGVLFVLLPSLLGSRPVTEAEPSRAAPTPAAPTRALEEAHGRGSDARAGRPSLVPGPGLGPDQGLA